MAMIKLHRFFDEAGNKQSFYAEDVFDKTTKKTAAQHMQDVTIHHTAEQINGMIDSALDALQTGDIKKLQDDLSSLQTVVNDFLTGEDNNDDVLNRLTELVKAISDNKDNIDALVDDKVAKADIVNDLTTGGVDKVLSAEQGKVLQAAIEALQALAHEHANKEILDGIGKSEVTGNLTYNGVELNGQTGIAYGTSLETANAYNGKLRIVVEDFDTEAAA